MSTCISTITTVVGVLMAVLIVMVVVFLAIIRPVVSVRVIISIASTRRFAVSRSSKRFMRFIEMRTVGIMMIEGVASFGVLIRHLWDLCIISWWVLLMVMVVLVGNIIGAGIKARVGGSRGGEGCRRH